jgi:hypothetical protein
MQRRNAWDLDSFPEFSSLNELKPAWHVPRLFKGIKI